MHQRGELIACGEKVADISYKQGGEGKKGKGEKKRAEDKWEDKYILDL